MLIQIHGGGFHNRGAQLMLWTTIKEISNRMKDVNFAVEPCFSTFQERANYDLLTLFPGALQHRPRKAKYVLKYGNSLSQLIPKSTSKTYGLARRSDVDALVDISGYAFGDKWGSSSTCQTMAQRVIKMTSQKKPAILLPQMFGPFQNKEVAGAFKPVVARSTLIYARDDESLKCLGDINETGRKLRLAPDITIFSGAIPVSNDDKSPYACLVPNARMLDKGDSHWEDNYLELMAASASVLDASGICPRILIHDGTNEDANLGKQLQERISLPQCDLIQEANPRIIKGIIGNANLLIGSRFHAIVASLSMGVPAIALGWAHKYDMIMQDFGVYEYLYKHTDDKDKLFDMIENLIDTDGRNEAKNRILQSKKEMASKNEVMWQEVIAALS